MNFTINRLQFIQGKFQEALMATYEYGEIYVMPRNALEIQKRLQNKVYVVVYTTQTISVYSYKLKIVQLFANATECPMMKSLLWKSVSYPSK